MIKFIFGIFKEDIIMMNFIKTGFLIILLYPAVSYGQAGSAQEEATLLYSEGKYDEALIKFKRLITLFPKDPKYYYYSGVCMVQTNTTPETAVQYLTQASELAVPRDVYFYLGKAYHYQYKFTEASDAYQKFQHFGTPDDKEKLPCDMYVSMARNGQGIHNYTKIQVFEKVNTNKQSMFGLFNEKMKGGQFVNKQEKLIKFKESAETYNWRFEPFLNEKGVFVFGSNNQGLIKHNHDIYQIQKLNGKQWSRPQSPGNSINTPFDDDYAYFNEAESALYFASMGHNSMGGYDIFKSVYNPDYKTWSEPVNLGYPINSPHNDYLFVPDDEQNCAWFVSDRETSGEKVMMYKVKFEKNYTYINIAPGFKFTNILLPEPETKQVRTKAPEIVSTVVVEVKAREQPQITADKAYPKELMQSGDYNKVVNDALTNQLKSDSVGRIIEELREKLNITQDESGRSAIKTRMFQLDKQARKYQIVADSLYTKARDYESKTTAANNSKTPVVTNNMAKAAFSQPKSGNTVVSGNGSAGKKTKKPVIFEFKVMSKSPYKTADEIPLDQPLPDGIIYRIQMGAFSQPIDPERFKGIIPISGETVNSKGVKKYYAGLFSRMSDAEKALIKIKEYSFKDAFIVAFYNGKQIPSNRAKELEN